MTFFSVLIVNNSTTTPFMAFRDSMKPQEYQYKNLGTLVFMVICLTVL